MKLGYIDYLNCYPFYYHMFEKKPLQGIRVFAGYPNLLNDLMSEGKLHMSPISSATCANIAGEVAILPWFCLSSVGYVGSVILNSRVPIEDLDRRKIGLTRASHTSVVLLKMVLEKYYHVAPVYIPAGPRPALEDMDAALIIGNDAMVTPPNPIPYSYDLGDLWLRLTGFPVVFAVFAVRNKIIAEYSSAIQTVITSFKRSLACLENEGQAVITRAGKRYPDIIFDIQTYYSLLRFEFTPDMKEALMFYYASAGELGLLKKCRRITYLEL